MTDETRPGFEPLLQADSEDAEHISVQKLHSQAMDLCDAADQFRRFGNHVSARECYRQAASLELRAMRRTRDVGITGVQYDLLLNSARECYLCAERREPEWGKYE